MNRKRYSILLVANWDSDVGYAWWLMESFWVKISESFREDYQALLAYPSISVIPSNIQNSTIAIKKINFNILTWKGILDQLCFIKSNDVKLIYLTDRPTFHWVYILYKLVGVKWIIVHDHSPGVRDKPSKLKSFLKKLINSTPLLSVDACFGASDFVRDRLINCNSVPAFKCFSIPNGLDLDVVKALNNEVTIQERLRLSDEAFVIVSVSRAHHVKGICFALDVISKVHAAAPDLDVHFVFLGDGPHLDDFKQRADLLKINTRTHFLGRVSDPFNYFNGVSMAFHPSLAEVGYSLSILEYMHHSIPVLVSDNPSVCGATIDRVTGIVYKTGDVDDTYT